MSASTVAIGLMLGVGGGLLAGLFGVGGGILFVPVFVGLGLGQLEAEATSLLAILPTVAAGAWRQSGYGNVRRRDALVLGLVSIVGVQAGVLIATSIDEDLLRRLFGLLIIGVAAQVAYRAYAAER